MFIFIGIRFLVSCNLLWFVCSVWQHLHSGQTWSCTTSFWSRLILGSHLIIQATLSSSCGLILSCMYVFRDRSPDSSPFGPGFHPKLTRRFTFWLLLLWSPFMCSGLRWFLLSIVIDCLPWPHGLASRAYLRDWKFFHPVNSDGRQCYGHGWTQFCTFQGWWGPNFFMMRALLVHIAWTLCCNRIFVCRRCIMNGQHQSDGTSF